MAARTLDLYDFSSPFITPTAPTPTAPAATATTAQGRTYMQRLAESTLFNASVVLAVFASIVYLLGTILAPFPLGQVTPSVNLGMWFGVITGGLAVAGGMTAVLVATVVRVTQ